jgi:DNA invertase Pin-like site-specific DNA recombinase
MTARHSAPTAALRAVLYVRVSTAEQADSGAGLAAQETALRVDAERRGWQVAAVHTDAGASGKSLDRRPGLADALRAVETGQADVLAVAKLDRLSRSVLDFAALMERSRRRGWGLVALDLGVDTSTPSGELMAGVVATFAQYERRLIGQRTRDALAEKRAQGVRLGRPQTLGQDVVARVVAERAEGHTLRAIAAALTADRVPTARGGAAWSSSSVQAVLASQAAHACP